MNVLIAHDRAKERTALKQLFERDGELSLVGEVAAADDLLSRLQETRPDLVLLNWELPGCQMSQLLSDIRCLHCPLKVVVFGEHPGAIRDALTAGAHAFVCKREPVEELLNTVRAVGGLSPCYV